MMYTVVGLWFDDAPLAAGAVEGSHVVDGDLAYNGFQPWAVTVEASGPNDAMGKAAQLMIDGSEVSE